MLRALLYLRLTSLKNFLRTQLLRLRQPKYLAGALFVVAYFWFFFFRRGAGSAAHAAATNPLLNGSPEFASLFLAVAALLLTGMFVLMWLLPSESPGIKFTEAEIAFLLPAPLSRRMLIHYKIVNAQLTSLLQSLFFALLFHHQRLLGGQALQTILAWWCVLSVISLHHLGASLTLARLDAAGVSVTRRRLVLTAALTAVIGSAAWWLWHHAGSENDLLDAAVRSGVLGAVLWPARLLLNPFFAATPSAYLLALLPALALLVIHYFWVARTEVAFEEASLSAAEKLAARVAEIRRTGTLRFSTRPRRSRRAPFHLARAPWPELAFLWKNLLSTARPWFTARVWLGCATGLIALSLALQLALGGAYWRAGGGLAMAGMAGAILTLFYGPLLTRLDLRQDLTNTDLLRTYPLAGWRIVLGEVLAPTVVLTAIIWLCLLAWHLGLHGHHPPTLPTTWFNPGMRLAIVGCLGVLTPFVVGLQLLVPNGGAILFPAMFRHGQTPGAGLDLMGQRMLFGFGQVLALILAFVPALALALGTQFILRGLLIVGATLGMWTGDSPAPAATLLSFTAVLLLAVAAEFALGVRWLGRRFEQIDLSAELRP